MEVFSTVASYIGTLGFPIVCCGVLFYFVNSTLKELRDIITKNTVAITTLIEKLDKEWNMSVLSFEELKNRKELKNNKYSFEELNEKLKGSYKYVSENQYKENE